MGKRIVPVAVLIFLFFLFIPGFTARAAPSWAYPLENYWQRQTLKPFAKLVDPDFYIDRERLFPNRFYGYHAGVDLEVLPGEDEMALPVYAVGSGVVDFVGPVSGYGGVILQYLDDSKITALYGHVKIAGLKPRSGTRVTAGEKLTVLGRGYSPETGGERPHLHFALATGHRHYFAGHEKDLASLNANWLDPNNFLAYRLPSPIPTSSPLAPVTETVAALPSLWFRFLAWLNRLF